MVDAAIPNDYCEQLVDSSIPSSTTREMGQESALANSLTTKQEGSPKRTIKITPTWVEVVEANSQEFVQTVLFETYHGFIEDVMDALLVVQAVITDHLKGFAGDTEDMASVKVRSGSVIVIAENSPYVKRWRVSVFFCRHHYIWKEFFIPLEGNLK
jgi:hypothetical protein